MKTDSPIVAARNLAPGATALQISDAAGETTTRRPGFHHRENKGDDRPDIGNP